MCKLFQISIVAVGLLIANCVHASDFVTDAKPDDFGSESEAQELYAREAAHQAYAREAAQVAIGAAAALAMTALIGWFAYLSSKRQSPPVAVSPRIDTSARLDSPSKRVFALVMAAGAILLVISLTIFFLAPGRHLVNIDYTYGWVTAGPGARQTDVSYTVDKACAAPLASAAVERARADLAAYLATRLTPQVGHVDFDEIPLRSALESAERASDELGVLSVREGEIRRVLKAPDIDLFPPSMGIPPPKQPRPVLSEAERFESALQNWLHIRFPKPISDQIYKTCLRTEPVAYVVTRTVWSTDLGRWLTEPYSVGALLLTLIGFLGAFAQEATFGRIAAWIRSG
jgi:hypothetical protein